MKLFLRKFYPPPSCPVARHQGVLGSGEPPFKEMEAAGEERGEGEEKEAGDALARSKEHWKSEGLGGRPLSSAPEP